MYASKDKFPGWSKRLAYDEKREEYNDEKTKKRDESKQEEGLPIRGTHEHL